MKTFFINLWNTIKTAYRTHVWLKWASLVVVVVIVGGVTTGIILGGNTPDVAPSQSSSSVTEDSSSMGGGGSSDNSTSAGDGSSGNGSSGDNSSNETADSSSEGASSHEHDYTSVVTDPTCEEKGFTTHTCSCGDSYIDTYVDELGHTYNKQVAEPTYKASEASCTSKATYYYSCECGEQGTETFEYGDYGHPTQEEWSFDRFYHWKNSTCSCNVKVDYAAHKLDSLNTCKNCNRYFTPTDGVTYTLSSDGTYAIVKGYTGTSTKVVVSATYQDKPVTEIAAEAFEEKTITGILLPDSVTSIGNNAFYNCRHLTDVAMGDFVISIGHWAFTNCTSSQCTIKDGLQYLGNEGNPYLYLLSANSSITSANIENGCKVICNSAFKDCLNLKSVTIPNSVTSIDNYAFQNCYGLKSVTIGNSVTFIGDNAFYYCHNLTSIIIPNSVTSIGGGAFYTCSSLTSVTIPDSVTSIGNQAFYNCYNLTSVTIPDSVTYIGNQAFYDCSNLQYNTKGELKYLGNANNPYVFLAGTVNYSIMSANIENGCKVVGDNVFNHSSLTSITLGDSLTYIGKKAFQSCSSLTSITIPDSVTSIGDNAFEYCSALTEIKFEGTIEQWNAITKGSNWKHFTPASKVICKNGEVAI